MTDRTSIYGMDSRAASHSLPQAPCLIGLYDVLELNARGFVSVASEITRMNSVLKDERWSNDEELDEKVCELLTGTLEEIVRAAGDIDARLTVVAASRMQNALNDPDSKLNVGYLRRAIRDIESRFADELDFIRLFVLAGDKAAYYQGAETHLRPETSDRYPGVRFDCDEAARCLALGRPTASVFHSMRAIEVAVASLARRLDIPDPIKPAERNWGMMLGKVKGAIDQAYPSTSRLPDSEGAFLEGVYVSLDAIKNPWRNATMHVESVYTEEEARHIFACTTKLLDKMAEGFAEDGQSVTTDDLALLPPQ